MKQTTIKSPHQTSLLTVVGKQLFMKRDEIFNEVTHRIIAYTNNWCIFYNHASENSIEIFCNNSWYTLPTYGFIYIAPFSIIEWKFPRGRLTYCMNYTFGAPPVLAPVYPAAFEVMKNISDLPEYDFIESVFKSSVGINLNRKTFNDSVVRRAKQSIASKFKEEIKISELAKELNTSHSVLSRKFKRCYGISAIEYRTQLRILCAHELLLYEQLSVGQTAQEIGFNDPKQFNKHFKDSTSLTPGHYTYKK